MVKFISDLFTKSKAYGKSPVAVRVQMASHNYEKYYSGHVDGDFGSFGKARVWRYSRNAEGEPIAQYKALIQDKGTFYQDEWGPWDEQYVSMTNELGHAVSEVRVLRSKPGGAPFMSSYPNIGDNPGLEPWKEDEDWSRAKVFDSLLRTWNYNTSPPPGATNPHGPKDTWQAIADFYRTHQTSDLLSLA